MHPRQHLDRIYRDLVPTKEEINAVQGFVNIAADEARRLVPVAEVHPAGSWAKGTMLRGRREADLVLVLAAPPHPDTLTDLRDHLEGLPGQASPPSVSHKAIQLRFEQGVSIDLLPVAMDGRTPEGPSVPRKLRHALSGIKHVHWLQAKAHGSTTHMVIRLMKHFRDRNKRDFHGLSSFAIEVLCVELARPGDLYQSFEAVLKALRDGWLKPEGRVRRLLDPVNPNNDLLEGFSASDAADVSIRAGKALEAIAADSWSRVFPSDKGTLPPPASNLGGRTLG